MGKVVTRLGWIVVIAVLLGALTIFAYNIGYGAGQGEIMVAGDKQIVDEKGAPSVTVAEGVVVGPTGLAIPVAGVKPDQLVDTYTQARAGGQRTHDAIDIMAAEGTPVIAAAPGRIEKLFFSNGGGGVTAYVRSDDGRWIYYYAHLLSYAPGLAEGQQIERGSPIGLVGHTGNANPAGPHLHFAIFRMNPGERWWQGTAINPYPLLAGKPPRG
ncbi:MAG TPA: M23 family metallopeptidase [Sphingomicrobium sp.]|jgi:murein DD-endopeptidase MepM/ murein hydrolase activator NlpD|nr:M23 family metallopeptidase [Sphingomicrobium sp.]